MDAGLSIGAAALETGLPVRTIRFYEAEGVLPAPSRTASGYRAYSANDVRRLRLIRNARTLGLGLDEIRTLVETAFASDCASFAPQLRALIAAKRIEARARVAELRRFERDLDALEQHVAHAEQNAQPGRMVAECGYCPMIDDER